MNGVQKLCVAVVVACCAGGAFAETRVRVATYNIKFLTTNVSNQGDRLTNLKKVVDLLEADVIGLQEIDSRAALEKVFPPDKWLLLIDDDSEDNQDLAIAVRKPLKVSGFDADLDADDQHFLFPAQPDQSLFPNRRDVLFAEVVDDRDVQSPQQFVVMVHHAKSRLGGRDATDPRRSGAAARVVQAMEQKFDGQNLILLGDLNDNPDDQSINILEVGDPTAVGGPEEIDGPFMANLTEPLLAADHVSWGLGPTHADPARPGRLRTVVPGSRAANNAGRGTADREKPILFDQILIPLHMKEAYVQGSCTVFDHLAAVDGPFNERASDHLPVFADFVFGATGDDGDGDPLPRPAVRITAVLPNPNGADAGNETVTVANDGSAALTLDGWVLRDRARTQFRLTGQVPAGQKKTFTLTTNTLALSNSGDDVLLVDDAGRTVHHVTYTATDAKAGRTIEFP